jgi:hypothetical protein
VILHSLLNFMLICVRYLLITDLFSKPLQYNCTVQFNVPIILHTPNTTWLDHHEVKLEAQYCD